MSRELEKVIRVEGKKFAPPSVVPAPVEVETENVWVSEQAVDSGVRCLRHFYPDKTREIALSALEAASPRLANPQGKAKTDIPQKAVEEAAKAMCAASMSPETWQLSDYKLKWVFREDALMMLEAVELNLRNSTK
jgi:hypothetical protein